MQSSMGKIFFPPNTVLLQGLAQFGSMAKDYAEKIKKMPSVN
jgi:hypothetical protein